MSKSVFSVDVEDWYQGIEIPMNKWEQYEKRVDQSMGRLLDLMDEYGVKATCFILGKTAEDHPEIVKKIHNRGHEIATHGYSHEKIYNLKPETFRNELRRSLNILEDLTGEQILGHRAPYFTITNQSLWALDILAEEGIRYDSSIHPVINWRYGILDAERTPSYIESQKGNYLLEVPVSTYPMGKINMPVGGGAYLRIYPYCFLRRYLKKLEKQGENIGFYLHPWEIDPDHPKINLPFKVSVTHYYNLASTEKKLKRLFSDFTFRPYKEVYAEKIQAIP